MDGQTSTYQNIQQPIQTPSPISPNETPKDKKGILFEIIFVVVFLAILFGILNFLNILPLSNLFPKQSQQYNPASPPTISPSEQAKQSLISSLPTSLDPSFIPQSSSAITLTKDKQDKEKLIAYWNNREGGTLWAIFPNPSNSKKITSLDVFFEQIQTASPSVEMAKLEVNKIFTSKPKGEWGCKNTLNEKTLYCENFWEEKDSKRGLGFLIMNTSALRGRLILSSCEHGRDSNLYSWKSCRSEFAESGVE